MDKLTQTREEERRRIAFVGLNGSIPNVVEQPQIIKSKG